MKQYNRIMLGKGGAYVEQCVQDGFIGVDFGIYQDLTNSLPEKWKDFNKEFIPIFFLKNIPTNRRLLPGWLAVCFGRFVKDCKLVML